MDEAMGLAASEVFRRSNEETFFTVGLNVKFIRPIKVPGIILCRAHVVETSSRKLFTNGSVEDAAGTVLASAEAIFVKTGVVNL